jgi:hypothetical protein
MVRSVALALESPPGWLAATAPPVAWERASTSIWYSMKVWMSAL